MSKFGKKKIQEEPEKIELQTSYEKMKRIRFKSTEFSEVEGIAFELVCGIPYEITFGTEDEANNNIVFAYLKGVTFGARGKVIKVSEYVYLFASDTAFNDGSLGKYLGNIDV